METLTQDLRYASRQLTRRPGFAAVAIASLALAIGGNSLIFGMLDGFVFNPFPYPDPSRLIVVGATFPKVSSDTRYVEALSPAEYADIRRTQGFARIGAFDLGNRNISGGDVPERVFTALVLDDLFPVIGMPPLLGRGFSSDELAPGGPRAAIISHRLWQTRFGADPAILSRAMRIGGEATTIVGVMPPGLLLIGTDLWIPWGGNVLAMPRNARQFTIIGRLAPGVSHAALNAELSSIARQVQQAEGAALPEYESWRLTATPFAAALMQDLRPAAFMLLAAVGLVLLIACANLANLLLARATSRSRDIAVRLALGAGRWRVARQLLTESALLAVLGTLGGLLLAYAGLQFAGSLIPAQFAMLGLEAGVNVRLIGWSILLASGAALLVAILPALHAVRTDPHDSLKSDGRIGTSRAGARMRQALVVGEIALSVVLLLGAGLLVRSFLNLQRVDAGFDPRGVLTMRLTLPQQKYETGEAITSFFEELVRRVEAVPGVRVASMASQFPPNEPFSSQIEVDGMDLGGATLPTANTTIASRGHFDTLGVAVLRGRTFGPQDTPEGPARVVVNRAFVARYIKDRDPLALRVRIVGRGGAGPWAEVIGVVADVRNNGMSGDVRPEVFISMERGRDAWNQLFLLVRSEGGDASSLLPSVRAAVTSIDPEQPVYAIQTLEDAVALSWFQQRVAATLLVAFAALALLLAGVGIFGVMAYSVSARTREIGVRIAVGAERGDVVWMVLSQVARLAIMGVAIGVALLLAAGQALRQLLYGVTPADATTIAIVVVTLGSVALLAGWLPARRASRINPVEALRYE